MSYFWTRTALPNLMNGLVQDVGNALVGSLAGRPDRVVVLPGIDVAWDSCQCGQLSIVCRRAYRSRNFPQDALDNYTKCIDFAMVFDLSMTLVRCVSIGEGPEPQAVYRPPSPVQTLHDLQVQEEDRAVVWETVDCSLSQLGQTNLLSSYILNESLTLGPQGMCAGSQLNFKVSLYGPCPCQPVPTS